MDFLEKYSLKLSTIQKLKNDKYIHRLFHVFFHNLKILFYLTTTWSREQTFYNKLECAEETSWILRLSKQQSGVRMKIKAFA